METRYKVHHCHGIDYDSSGRCKQVCLAHNKVSLCRVMYLFQNSPNNTQHQDKSTFHNPVSLHYKAFLKNESDLDMFE
jgi:hypothetical protein